MAAKYTYAVEVFAFGGWQPLCGLSGLTVGYARGYFEACRSMPGPKPAKRIVRSDGKVLDQTEAVVEVSIGMVAGLPTAEQYEYAATVALEMARQIREREEAGRA